MDNCKIRVYSQTEVEDAKKLFFELGAKSYVDNKPFGSCPVVGLLFLDGELSSAYSDLAYRSINVQEITFEHLKDMAVLKRNSIDDATHADNYHDGRLRFYMTSDRDVYVYEVDGFKRGWIKSGIYPKELKPIQKLEEGLISGAEALRALADGKSVEWQDDNGVWWSLGVGWTWNQIVNSLNGIKALRLKPHTITINGIEIDRPKEIDWCSHQKCVRIKYETEEQLIAATELLKGIFEVN